jgi:hypothetical protein
MMEVGQTEILMRLATNLYLYDDGNGVVLKSTGGRIIEITDADGRKVDARFSYAMIEGLLMHHYIEQAKTDGRIYRITHAGIRAANS